MGGDVAGVVALKAYRRWPDGQRQGRHDNTSPRAGEVFRLPTRRAMQMIALADAGFDFGRLGEAAPPPFRRRASSRRRLR